MVKPKKRLGQHFLTDENIARKIISSLSGNIKNVVEIGSGIGILTKYLLQNQEINAFFFEVDHESVEYLKLKYPSIGTRLIEADFLGYDLRLVPGPFAVIGNFPYNISSQILFKILDHHDRIPEVIGMFQKEVAERIASPAGSKKYGILSVLVRAFYNIEYLFTVSENVFYPPPKVKSAVIRLIRNDQAKLNCNEALFFRVVKTAFNQRRKTLRNALKSLPLSDSANKEGFLSKRAEQLSVEDFVFLTNEIKS